MLRLTVRRELGTQTQLVSSELQLIFLPTQMKIRNQQDRIVDECRTLGACSPPTLPIPVEVRLYCPEFCIEAERWHYDDWINTCRTYCEKQQDLPRRGEICGFFMYSHLFGQCGLPKDPAKAADYAQFASLNLRSSAAERLASAVPPPDPELALRILGCHPDAERERRCSLPALQIKFLWDSNRPEWQRSALQIAISNCPVGPDADPCHHYDWACSSAAKYLSSDKLGPAQPEAAQKYLDMMESRLGECPADDD